MTTPDTEEKRPAVFNTAPYTTAARYVLSYAGGAITAFSALHLISATDAQNLSGAVQAIATGVTTAAGGLMTLATFAAGIYGTWTSTRAAQKAAVTADPKVAAIVMVNPLDAIKTDDKKVITVTQAKGLAP